MGSEGDDGGPMMALAGPACLPVMLLYLVAQRRVVDGFVRSGLRGGPPARRSQRVIIRTGPPRDGPGRIGIPKSPARVQNQQMSSSARPLGAVPDGHVGFVAGRYRNGAYSDIWTDVRRCAERTFTAYAPACSCGWIGPPQPPTEVGHLHSRRIWRHEHVGRLPTPPPTAPGPATLPV
jgi:hypothetical protein